MLRNSAICCRLVAAVAQHVRFVAQQAAQQVAQQIAQVEFDYNGSSNLTVSCCWFLVRTQFLLHGDEVLAHRLQDEECKCIVMTTYSVN